MTPYQTIYDRFLKRIEDTDLFLLSEEQQDEVLKGYLDTAVMYIQVESLRMHNNLEMKEEGFVSDLTNEEMELIAMFMVVAWYEPKIHSLETTLMFVGASSEKWTDQKRHKEMLEASREKVWLEARNYYKKYAMKHNNYLGSR